MAFNRQDLDRCLNPRVVAVVGDKRPNYMWLRNMSTFVGKVYSVQIDPNEIPGIEALGIPNYPSLMDIPDGVDFVVCAVPREIAPRIVADCVKKKVGGVSLFTSGFAETDTEKGRQLQESITRIAKEGGLNLIGPNCMGLYNPLVGVRMGGGGELHTGEAGSVSFLSQSGNHGVTFCSVGAMHGIKIRLGISYGNAAVLDSPDYLDYLAQDEATRIIGIYLEGPKDGRRFVDSLRPLVGKKPVVIWKGGQTVEGARAVASHTGSLAHSMAVWETVFKQFGVIRADSLDDTVDIIKGLLFLKKATGDRVGLIGATGGQSVVITDSFAKAGLKVPVLGKASLDELSTFFNIVGGSYKNPLDVSNTFRSVEIGVRLLDILDRDPNVDAICMETSAGLLGGRRDVKFASDLFKALGEFRERSSKPFLTVVTAGTMEAQAVALREALAEQKIPAYPTFQRAAGALRRIVDYYQFVESLSQKV